MKVKNDQLSNELKKANDEIAELKQALATKDRRIGQLQSNNAVLVANS